MADVKLLLTADDFQVVKLMEQWQQEARAAGAATSAAAKTSTDGLKQVVNETKRVTSGLEAVTDAAEDAGKKNEAAAKSATDAAKVTAKEAEAATKKVKKLGEEVSKTTTTAQGAQQAQAKVGASAKDAYDKATGSVSRFGENAKKGTGAASLGMAAAGGAAVIAAGLIIQAGASLGQLVNEASLMYREQVRGELQLRNALGGRVDVTNRLLKSARELSEATAIPDEAITSQQAYLAELGIAEDQIEDITRAAVDYAAGTGKTFEEAVGELAETLDANTTSTLNSVEGVNQLTDAQLRAGGAIDAVSRKYEGQAADLKKNVGGTEALGESLGELLEAFGSLVAGPISKFANQLSRGLNVINDWLRPARDQSAALDENRLKHMAYVEQLKAGNLPQERQGELIDLVNGQLKKFGDQQIDATSTTDDLTKAQDSLNKSLLKQAAIMELKDKYVDIQRQKIKEDKLNAEQTQKQTEYQLDVGRREASGDITLEESVRALGEATRNAHVAKNAPRFSSQITEAEDELNEAAKTFGFNSAEELFGDEPTKQGSEAGRKSVRKIVQAYADEMRAQLEQLEGFELSSALIIADDAEKIDLELAATLKKYDQFAAELRATFKSLGKEEEFVIGVLPRIESLKEQEVLLAEYQKAILRDTGIQSIDFLEIKPVISVNPSAEVVPGSIDQIKGDIEKDFQSIGKSIQDALGLEDLEFAVVEETFFNALNAVQSAITAQTDAQIADNERLVDSLRDRISETENALNEEQRLQKLGFANNVAAKEKELEELRAKEAEAIRKRQMLKKKAAKEQFIADAAIQITNLVTATTNIFKEFSGIPIVGIPLALVAIGTMFAGLAAAKSKSRAAATRLNTGDRLPRFGRTDANGANGRMIEGTNFMVGDGEWVMGERVSEKHDRLLGAINRDDMEAARKIMGTAKSEALHAELATVPQRYQQSLDYYFPLPPEGWKERKREAERAERREDYSQALSETVRKEVRAQTDAILAKMDESEHYIPVEGGYLHVTKKGGSEHRSRVRDTKF